jgi:anaerobic ribonucleoside-triphosphate reductase activating protein
MKLRLNSILRSSYANGPGNRFVIWTQGCNFNCPGCFNPETHSSDGGYEIETGELFEKIKAEKGIEGLSISGGEPLLQADGLMFLLKRIKEETDLSVLVFTGFEYEEILKDESKNKILKFTDILISGKYDKNQKVNNFLISTANQKLYFLTDRYNVRHIPDTDCEIIINGDGRITITGIRVPFEI